MRVWGIEPEYKHMHCRGERTVDDMCPEESCDLYGCQEAILEVIKNGANWGLFAFTSAAVFYFAGAIHLFFVGRANYYDTQLETSEEIPHEEEEIIDLRTH
jgi:hypothetical protein